MVIQGKSKPKPPERPPPTSRITKITSLQRFPDKEYAATILHDVAKAVAPLMHENNFKVGVLCEMFPKNANLLGLNVNKGQKIMLRLRYHSNDRSFLPMTDIIGTMLHELTHNLVGPHNADFYRHLDRLQDRFDQVRYQPDLVKGYVCEENKLGGRRLNVREQRVKAVTKFKSERRKLGGEKKDKLILELVREAAERRWKDSVWCGGVVDLTGDLEVETETVGDLGVEKGETELVGDLGVETVDVEDLEAVEESAQGQTEGKDKEIIVID